MSAAFDEAQLNDVCVEGDVAGVVSIDRSCVTFFRDDATWGNGFSGDISVRFLETVGVTANVKFGSVRSFDYWYVDGLASFNPGILLPSATNLAIYGFGGGAGYHVSQGPLPTPTDVNDGLSSARPIYRPDRGTALLLKATVILGTAPTPESFNADLTLTATFDTLSWGLRDLQLEGNAYLMADHTSRSSDPPVSGHANIYYNFPERTLDASFGMRLEQSGFSGRGTLQLYSGPHGWFLSIGRPIPVSDRVTISLLGIVDVRSYLMIGNRIPTGLPPPPEHAPRIVRNANMTDVHEGRGFIFGASASFDYEGHYLIFYGRINAGIGFDLSLINFGERATCELSSGRRIRLGMDGWYAHGQLYAYLSGSIGIEVDVWFTSGRFEIIELGAGATLQGGMPNPTWAKGRVVGYYELFGGLVEGYCDYDFEVGEECRPVAPSPLTRIDLVTDFRPANNETVDIFAEPMAAFAVDLDTPFELRDMNGNVRTFRVRTDGIVLRLDNEHGTRVSGRSTLSPERQYVALTPTGSLLPNTTYWAQVNARGEELIDERWQRAQTPEGTEITQRVTVRFYTGVAPNTLNPEHVLYTYPFNRQRYFLQDECRNGVVDLRHNYSSARWTQPRRAGNVVSYVARFLRLPDGTPIDIDANFEGSRFTFAIPELAPETSYAVQIIRRERRPRTRRDMIREEDVSVTSSRFSDLVSERYRRHMFEGATFVQIRVRELPGTRVRPDEQLLYNFYFKSSRYRTLRDKLAAATFHTARPAGLNLIETSTILQENFDLFDKEGFPVTYGPYSSEGTIKYLRLNLPWTSRWARDYTRYWIYDIWQRLTNLGVTRQRTSRELITREGRMAYLASNFPVDGPLSDAELMPSSRSSPGRYAYYSTHSSPSSASSASTASSVSSASSPYIRTSTGTSPQQPRLILQQGFIAMWDYATMRMNISIARRLGRPRRGSSDYNRMMAANNREFQPPFSNDRYTIQFQYKPPVCYGQDETVPTVNKSILYRR
jgi:hypothetical protein